MDNGVIKKLDELGRIVIPKDIRKNLKINNGDILKIYVDGGNIQLAKYSDVQYNVEHIKKVFEAFKETFRIDIAFTDKESVLLSTNESITGKIDNKLIILLKNSERLINNEVESYCFDNKKVDGYFYFVPIITTLASVGAIILYSKEQIKEYYQDLLQFISKYVSKLVDISC
ncbi:MAG: AbrB/MazE/SpoVT family DNA-binding domain-containing protein [Bacilli bacterium]